MIQRPLSDYPDAKPVVGAGSIAPEIAVLLVRVVAAWSVYELEQNRMVARYMGSTLPRVVAQMFDVVDAPGTRARMLEALAEARLPEDDQRLFKATLSRIGQAKSFRNDVAHSLIGLGVQPTLPDPDSRLLLPQPHLLLMEMHGTFPGLAEADALVDQLRQLEADARAEHDSSRRRSLLERAKSIAQPGSDLVDSTKATVYDLDALKEEAALAEKVPHQMNRLAALVTPTAQKARTALADPQFAEHVKRLRPNPQGKAPTPR